MLKGFMKNNLLKKTVLMLSVMSLSLVTVFAYVHFTPQNPEKIVKKYWEYCLKQDFESAENLSCAGNKCSNVKTEGVDSKGNKIGRDGKEIDRCCYAKKIADEKLKITKIIEVKTGKKFAQVTVEAENKEQQSEKYISCLMKDTNSNKWRISEIVLMSSFYSPDISDECYVRLESQ